MASAPDNMGDDELAAALAVGVSDAPVDGTPELNAKVRGLREALALVPLGAPRVPATNALRDLIFASIDPATPYAGFVRRTAELFDLSETRAREIFGELGDPECWEPTLLDSIKTFHFDGGPRAASADCGITRFGAGTVFPPHTHVGHETMLLLEGAIRFDDGRVARVGDRVEMTNGTRHSFTVIEDTVCAVFLEGHIELLRRRAPTAARGCGV